MEAVETDQAQQEEEETNQAVRRYLDAAARPAAMATDGQEESATGEIRNKIERVIERQCKALPPKIEGDVEAKATSTTGEGAGRGEPGKASLATAVTA